MNSIEKWAKETQKAIIDKYNNMGLRASGQFERELENDVEISDSKISVKFKAPEYSYNLIYGRRAGKMPPRAAILKWIDDKKIAFSGIKKESLAFLIQRKIGNEGIKVPNQYNSGELLSAFDDKVNDVESYLSDYILPQIESRVIKKFES